MERGFVALGMETPRRSPNARLLTPSVRDCDRIAFPPMRRGFPSPRCSTLFRATAWAVMAVLVTGCSAGSTVDTAARDRCESKWGVGNCVERSEKWVPLAAVTSTTSTTSVPSAHEATTTSVASTTPSTTTTATTTPPPPKPTVLSPGEVLGVRFGTPESEAMPRLVEILGPPTKAEDTSINGGVGNSRTFGSLTIFFSSTRSGKATSSSVDGSSNLRAQPGSPTLGSPLATPCQHCWPRTQLQL